MELRGSEALVTGSTGFVGSHVSQRLAEVEGMTVRALTRSAQFPEIPRLISPRIKLLRGDVLDPQSLDSAVRGVKVVVHAAFDRTPNRRLFRRTIEDGTRNLYEAAQRHGVERFIFLSSLSVYYGSLTRFGDDMPGEQQDIPLVVSGDEYADAKIVAERLLTRQPEKMPRVAILRAAAIVGPGSPRWGLDLLQAAQRGRLWLPGGGFFPFPHVYIDDMVDAVVAALRCDHALGAFDIVGDRVPYRQFAEHFAHLAGTKPRYLPMWLAWMAALGSEVSSLATGRWVRNSRTLVNAMATPRTSFLTTDKARNELKWTPKVSFEGVLRQMEEWLTEEGYLT
jgi:2-alkyl-3-oxoalkanoate reductase